MNKKLKYIFFLFLYNINNQTTNSLSLKNERTMADQEFIRIQTRLGQLYTGCIELSADQINNEIQELTNQMHEMIRIKQEQERSKNNNDSSSRVVYLRPNTRPPELFVPEPIARPRPRPRYSDAHTQRPGRRGRRPILTIEDDEDIIPVETNRQQVVAAVQIQQFVKLKTISSDLFATECADVCAICMEKHTIGNSIKTECTHEFGKQCFQMWMQASNSNHKCPTCRKECPQIVMFRT